MINCEFENGNKANLRHLTCDVVLRDEQGRLLLARRAEWMVEGGKWGIPGGFMDRDENTRQAAMREVLEETGYECSELRLMAICDDPKRNADIRQNVTVVFAGLAGRQVAETDGEVTEMEWFAIDELPPVDQLAFDHALLIDLWKKFEREPWDYPVFTSELAQPSDS